jgi:cell wall assembly regulator SMI1
MFPPKRARPRPSKTVAESWERIERWYAEYAAPLTPSWPPGASAAAIRQFEKAIGATLPDEFKESVRIHDGGGDWWVPWREGELLSLDGILKEWRWYFEWYAKGDDAPDDEDEDDSDLDELQGPIKRVVWNQTRIPVTNNSSNHLMLDLDPPADGVYGQLIDHTRSAGPTRVVATGWGEFLRNLVADLESGRYVYLEHQGGLETVEELERDLG